MSMRSLMTILFSISMLGLSCKESKEAPLAGVYSGEFYARYPGYTGLRKSPEKVMIRLDGVGFRSSASADRFPAGGSGTYRISGKHITFTDTNFWTADFDWSLILNGKFEFRTKGDSLILTRAYDPCPECSSIPNIGIYRLKRE